MRQCPHRPRRRTPATHQIPTPTLPPQTRQLDTSLHQHTPMDSPPRQCPPPWRSPTRPQMLLAHRLPHPSSPAPTMASPACTPLLLPSHLPRLLKVLPTTNTVAMTTGRPSSRVSPARMATSMGSRRGQTSFLLRQPLRLPSMDSRAASDRMGSAARSHPHLLPLPLPVLPLSRCSHLFRSSRCHSPTRGCPRAWRPSMATCTISTPTCTMPTCTCTQIPIPTMALAAPIHPRLATPASLPLSVARLTHPRCLLAVQSTATHMRRRRRHPCLAA
mmetsp:Transcript_323/g.836  ORF Transcript_323/g.836 Transcript_323/m.836 type:complete len:274 (+) Transcript_323:1241-2062(+)